MERFVDKSEIILPADTSEVREFDIDPVSFYNLLTLDNQNHKQKEIGFMHGVPRLEMAPLIHTYDFLHEEARLGLFSEAVLHLEKHRIIAEKILSSHDVVPIYSEDYWKAISELEWLKSPIDIADKLINDMHEYLAAKSLHLGRDSVGREQINDDLARHNRWKAVAETYKKRLTLAAELGAMTTGETIQIDQNAYVHMDASIMRERLLQTLAQSTIDSARAEYYQKVALVDQLTGLPNRRALEIWGEKNYDPQKRYALLAVDLEGFKYLNDYDYNAGDEGLRQYAERLVHNVRHSANHASLAVGSTIDDVNEHRKDIDLKDEVFTMSTRLGGDEYMVLIDLDHLDEPTAKLVAQIVQNRIRSLRINDNQLLPENLREMYAVKGRCSMVLNETGEAFTEFLARANSTIDEEKKNNKVQKTNILEKQNLSFS